MPIEFRCDQCRKLLRTPDDTAGKLAKCPECGSVVTIPEPAPGQAGAGGGVPPWSTTAAGPVASPFASPTPVSDAVFGAGQADGYGWTAALRPTRIDLADVFSRTWELFKQQWAMCLAAWLITAVAGGVAFMVGIAVVGVLRAILGGLGGFLGWLALVLCFAWLGVGNMIFCLRLARGQRASFEDLFSGGPYLGNFVLAAVLFNVIVFAGALLFVIPGIIFALMFSQHALLVIDRKAGALEALSMSQELTHGNKLTLLAIFLVAGIVGNVLVLATCGLGALVVVPYMMLLAPVVYLAMSGQSVVESAAGRGMGQG